MCANGGAGGELVSYTGFAIAARQITFLSLCAKRRSWGRLVARGGAGVCTLRVILYICG